MAFRFSTKLRNMLLSGVPAASHATITDTTIAAVDGGGGADSFTDSGNGFVDAGFSVGDSVIVFGFTGGMAAIHGPFTLTSVTAGTMEVATGSLAGDAAGESVTITALKGGSIRDIFKDGILRIYSGSQPASANAAATGTLLVEITVGSGAWVAGSPDNGLEFGAASAGVLSKDTDVWSGVGLADGIAGWYRLYANPTDTGALDNSAVYPRIDGSVGTAGTQLIASSTNIVTSSTITIDSFSITLAEEGA